MLNPTAQRTVGLCALTLSLLTGTRLVPALAQTSTPPPAPGTPPPVTIPQTTPPVTTPPVTPPPATDPAAAPPAVTPPAATAATPVPAQPVAAPQPTRRTPPQGVGSVGRPMMAPPPKPAVKLPPNVCAIVDGAQITRDDVLGMLELMHGRSVVTQLIQIKALQAEAKRQGVTVSPAEVTASIKQIKDDVVQRQMQSGQPPMTFDEIAKEQGFSPDYIEWNAYLDTLRKKTFRKVVSTQIPPLSGQIKVAHILIATIPLGAQGQEVKPTSAADQAKKDTEAKTKIEGILTDIKSGKITFEDAAKQYSDDKSNAADGGALPYASHGTFDPSFEQAAFGIAKVGDITGPIKSQFGWHLIKLIALGKNAPAAEQQGYRDQQIEQIMKDQRTMQSWFNQVIQKAQISINPAPVLVANPKSPLNGLNLPPAGKTAAR